MKKIVAIAILVVAVLGLIAFLTYGVYGESNGEYSIGISLLIALGSIACGVAIYAAISWAANVVIDMLDEEEGEDE